MNDLQSKLDAFKNIVIENSQSESFEYHEWFIADHLLIVERIATELCGTYPDADRDIVRALVWFHDFGKPIDMKNERSVTESKAPEAMKDIGFPEDFIEKILSSWQRMEMKESIDIAHESIEVQIVSTADGASHFVGKFYSSYFHDSPTESIKHIEQRLREKITKDWERKIVLPEIKEAFRTRYEKAREIVGEYPDKFLD